MKRRKPHTNHRPLRIRITNEEIMRDLLFPSTPPEVRSAPRRGSRR